MSTSAVRSRSVEIDAEVERAVAFLVRLFPPPRDFAIRLWQGHVIPAEGTPRFRLIVSAGPLLRAMFRPPVEASLGNAYIAGVLDVDGDLVAAFSVLDSFRRAVHSRSEVLDLVRAWRGLPKSADRIPSAIAPPARLSGKRHTPDRDREAVRFHYDLGNDFYALFLDPGMIYSCGYFPTGAEDLARAQSLKLDHVCRKLRLRRDERLLDVGCGWGGLLIHAARRYGVRGVGITLSERQHALARQRIAEAGLSDRLEVRIADYRTLERETFDKVASIGMFEHVGEARLPDYFERIYDVVRPGGVFLNHGISIQKIRPRSGLRALLTDPLDRLVVGRSRLTRTVFPDSELIPLSEVNAAAEGAGWEVRDVENLREHYATTLRHWIRNLEAREEEALRLVGNATYRAWRLYFAGAAHYFDVGRMNVNQSLLAKLHADGYAEVPASRADVYRRW